MAHRLLPRAALEVSPMTRCLRALLEIDERHKRQQTDAGEHKQISVGGGWNSLSRTRGFRRVSDFLFLVALILVISSLQEGFHRPPQSTAHACISAALGETFTWPGGGVAGVGALTHAPGQGKLSSIYAASGPAAGRYRIQCCALRSGTSHCGTGGQRQPNQRQAASQQKPRMSRGQ